MNLTTNMTKQILMPNGNLKRLQQHMKVSQPTLIRALRYRTDTKLADRIREAAIQYFDGVLLDKTNKNEPTKQLLP